jgi:hypothetical protein
VQNKKAVRALFLLGIVSGVMLISALSHSFWRHGYGNPLHRAVIRRDFSTQLQTEHVDDDAQIPYYYVKYNLSNITPLMIAVVEDDRDAIRWLVANGSTTQPSDASRNPLYLAIQLGRHECIQELILSGASPMSLGPDGRPLVVTAAIKRDASSVVILLRCAETDENEVVSLCSDVLCCFGSTDMVGLIDAVADCGFKPDDRIVCDPQSATLLMYAARYSTPHTIRKLIKDTIDINAVDRDGVSALGYALSRTDRFRDSIVELLQQVAD